MDCGKTPVMALTFEAAMKAGDLEAARADLERLARLPEHGGLYLPECFSDLAQALGRRGDPDAAIETLERGMEFGLGGEPGPQSDIAEMHVRAGRTEVAEGIWAQMLSNDPQAIWVYNAAGLTYQELDLHEPAVDWLARGLRFAFDTGDPEGLVAQLADVRGSSLRALGREPDELQAHADTFLASWTPPARTTNPAWIFPSDHAAEEEHVAVALAWFPSGEYERARELWPSLDEDWHGVTHTEYCARLDGHAKWMRRHGVTIRAIAPIHVDPFLAWCAERGEDPEDSRAPYAADRFRTGDAIAWPPGRNDPCWCQSGRKHKKCCGPAPAREMFA